MIYFKRYLKCIIPCCGLLLASVCHADDGLTPGPGVFSGERGEFSLGQVFRQKQGITAGEAMRLEAVATAVSAPAQDVATYNEETHFLLYKEWRRLREQNPDLYESFELWLEYQAYLRSKSLD